VLEEGGGLLAFPVHASSHTTSYRWSVPRRRLCQTVLASRDAPRQSSLISSPRATRICYDDVSSPSTAPTPSTTTPERFVHQEAFETAQWSNRCAFV